MALLLNIDAATEHASVCLSQDGVLLALEESHEQKNHGSFLQPAIKRMFSSINLPLLSVDAIAVTQGPGSYTGLRVGMASAKGLCYALGKPLILLNTLQVMASASIKEAINKKQHTTTALFCPMIDARRMEVFTAIYDCLLHEILPPSAMILSEESFATQLNSHSIIFSGNGHAKLKDVLHHPNAQYMNNQYNAVDMIVLAEQMVQFKQFTSLAYSEPSYLKEFYGPLPKH